MFTPSCFARVAQLVTDPALAGHPVVASWSGCRPCNRRWLRVRGTAGPALPYGRRALTRCQMHDLLVLPPLAVTEHRVHAVCCLGCRIRTRAARLAPESARQRAQALAVPVACMDETGLQVAEQAPEGGTHRGYAQAAPHPQCGALGSGSLAAQPRVHGWRSLTLHTVAEQLPISLTGG